MKGGAAAATEMDGGVEGVRSRGAGREGEGEEEAGRQRRRMRRDARQGRSAGACCGMKVIGVS